MRTRRRDLFGGGLLALTLMVGACGGDDSPVKSDAAQPIATTTVVTAPARPTFAPGTTMAAIQAKGKVVVGTRLDLTGFGVKTASGVWEGFDVEIAKLIAVGIFGGTPADVVSKIEFVDAPMDRREALIKDGQVDFAIAAFRITDAAKQQIDFAGPYLIAGQDLLVRSTDTAIKGFSDLAGKKVCSSRATGTAAANVKAKAPEAESIQMDTTPQCADALVAGQVDAVASVNTSLLGPLERSAGAIKLVGNPSTEEPNGIGVKRGDDAFRTFINDRLEKLFTGGQWASAYAATLGKFGWKTPTTLPTIDRYATAAATTSTSRP